MSERIAGFFSYSRFDDDYRRGLLSEIRAHIEGAVRSLTGKDSFDLFQDVEDIAPGEAWQTRLKDAVDGSTIFIPVVTTNFLDSAWCREETERFVRHEAELGRDDLIFPLQLTPVEALDGDAPADPIVSALAGHQRVDIAAFREDDGVSRELRIVLQPLAARIAELVRSTRRDRTRPQLPPPEARVLVVSRFGGGTHASLTEAVAAVPTGGRIEVHRGLHRGAITIDRPMEIVGIGDREDIVVEAVDEVAVTVLGDARLEHLTVRVLGSTSALISHDGRLELESCQLVSEGRAAVEIEALADPIVRNCRIEAEGGSGIVLRDRARGSFEGCEILSRTEAIVVTSRATPRIRRCRVVSSADNALWIHDDGRGTIEENELTSSGPPDRPAVLIESGGDPTLRKNHITSANGNALLVADNGKGTIDNNELSSNGADRPAVVISSGGDPTLRNKNHIISTDSYALWVRDGGRGTIEGNELTSDREPAVVVESGGDPTLRSNHITSTNSNALLVADNGKGTIDNNELSCNGTDTPAVVVESGGDPTLRNNNRITSANSYALWVRDGGKGTIDGNELTSDSEAAVVVESGGDPTLRNNHITSTNSNALVVRDDGRGTIDNNELSSNGTNAPAVVIRSGGDPTLRNNNRVLSTNSNALLVTDSGKGTIDNNELSSDGNDTPAVVVESEGDPTLRRNRVSSTKSNALWIHDGGHGTIEDNVLRSEAREAVDVQSAGACRVANNRLHVPTGKDGFEGQSSGDARLEGNTVVHG